MDREKVIDLLLRARTADECEKAGKALDLWMRAHPDDHTMRDAAEYLDLVQLGPGDELGHPKRPTVEDLPESERVYFTSPDYAVSFEDDVRAAMERFGWGDAEA